MPDTVLENLYSLMPLILKWSCILHYGWEKGSQGINSGCWAPRRDIFVESCFLSFRNCQIIPLPKEETRTLELIWWTNKEEGKYLRNQEMIPCLLGIIKVSLKKKKTRGTTEQNIQRLISLLGFRGNTLIQMFLNSSISYIQYHFLIYYGKILKKNFVPKLTYLLTHSTRF